MKKIVALALALLLPLSTLTPGALAVEHAAPPVQPEENPLPDVWTEVSTAEELFAAGAVRAALGDQSRLGAVEQTLLSLGDVVGIKPLEEQLAALSGAGLLLEQEWERARERSRRYGGLSRRLGLLLGLLAVVVLA